MAFIKKGNYLLLFSLFILFLLCGCKRDFSVNSDSEPFTIVYGLLNTSENAQYVKIFKSFLVEGNAYDVVKDINKYSYIDSIEVCLNEYDERNKLVREIRLDTTTAIPKDEGVFLYPTQILYTTSATLNKDYTYELTVFNPYTKDITKTKQPFALVGNTNITRPVGTELSITDKDITFVFFTGKNTTNYQLILKYYYTEDLNDHTSRQPAPVVWNLGTVEDLSATAGIEKTLRISGSNFFKRIRESVMNDDRVIARHTDFIVVEVYSAAKDWGLYLQSNLPSSGINQDKLLYSNIIAYNAETNKENYAMGVFSSRGITTKRYNNLMVANGSRDSLFRGRFTGDLKFTDIY
jgi:hypothetical protein